MKNIIYIVLIAVSVLTSACQGTSENTDQVPPEDGVTVTFREIRENIAYFDIRNGTMEDIMTLNVELSFLDGNGDVIKVDSVSYAMVADSIGISEPFLKVGDETFVVQSVVPGTVSASARRLE